MPEKACRISAGLEGDAVNFADRETTMLANYNRAESVDMSRDSNLSTYHLQCVQAHNGQCLHRRCFLVFRFPEEDM